MFHYWILIALTSIIGTFNYTQFIFVQYNKIIMSSTISLRIRDIYCRLRFAEKKQVFTNEFIVTAGVMDAF